MRTGIAARSSNPRVAVFRSLVREVMNRELAPVLESDPVGEVVDRFRKSGRSAVLVVDPNGRLAGIVTERDIVHRLGLFSPDGNRPTREVMSAPVDTIQADDFLYHAVARMRRFHRHHFPVVDDDHRPVGIVRLDLALASALGPLMEQVDRLTRDDTEEGLTSVKAAQHGLARELLNEGVAAPDIQAVITHINNDIYRRVTERQLAAMRADGRGEPPVPFTVIVMGSGGRGESFVSPDQDNGFILADYPDSAHAKIDGWFIELASRMTRELDAVGFPLCKGGVMATNPVWRKTLSQWRAQTDLWTRRRSTVAIRLGDIFFDFLPVFGDFSQAKALRAHVTDVTRRRPALLRDICEHDAEHRTALGLFGRLRTESEVDAQKGKINLKYNGTMPLVAAVRLLALRHGVAETGTLARLRALTGEIGDDPLDSLLGAYRTITTILLRQQMDDFEAGIEPSSYVHPDGLTTRERQLLVQGFRAIEELRERVYADFTGDVF